MARSHREAGVDVVGAHGEVSALLLLPVLCIISGRRMLDMRAHTIEPPRRPHNGLYDAHHVLQPLPDISILCLDRLLVLEHHLQVMVWLLALQVPDALVQPIDLVLSPLADGALSFTVVGAFAGQLLGCEVRDTTRAAYAPLLGRLTPVGWIIVPMRR